MASKENLELLPGEEILVRTRPAVRSFTVFIFGMILCSVGPFIKEDPPLSPTAGLVFALVFLVMILRRWSNVYTLTNMRIAVRGGLIERDTYAINLADLDAVEVHQGFTLRLLKAGHLYIRSRLSHAESIIIYGLPDPFAFQEKLESLAAGTRNGRAGREPGGNGD